MRERDDSPRAGREQRMKALFYYRGIESLGVGSLMSYLRSRGHQAELIFDPGLDDNLFIRIKPLERFNRFESLVERAREFDPDVIAVSIPTNLYPFVNRTLSRLKREFAVPVIAGGPHVSALPEYVMQNELIDMICLGEGEEAFAELLDRMENGGDITTVRNIWVKKGGEIFRNETRPLIQDLDALPFPEKQVFREYGCFQDNYEIVTGRGCPFRCTFCNIHYQRKMAEGKGRFVRRRSVRNVLCELTERLRLYDMKYVSFHDDTFTADRQWVEEFCEGYRREVNLPFYCFAYPTTVDEPLMRQLKSANCMQIFMGLDSGDPRMRTELLKRPMTDERILSSARIVKDAGVNLQVSTIFGFPGEEPESMWKTLDLAEKAGADLVSGYIFYPFPSTELYEHCIDTGYLTAGEVERVWRGEAGYHHDSVLRHPYKKLAVTISKLIPLYNKAPLLRPLLRRLMQKQNEKLASFVYLLSIPFAFPFLGLEGIKTTIRMAVHAYRMSKGRRGQSPAPAR